MTNSLSDHWLLLQSLNITSRSVHTDTQRGECYRSERDSNPQLGSICVQDRVQSELVRLIDDGNGHNHDKGADKMDTTFWKPFVGQVT
jgi:hypothetical protein